MTNQKLHLLTIITTKTETDSQNTGTAEQNTHYGTMSNSYSLFT